MKNWGGRASSRAVARKTMFQLARGDARPPTLEGHPYFGNTLQPAIFVLILNKLFPAVT
jgi:hypothetical protein